MWGVNNLFVLELLKVIDGVCINNKDLNVKFHGISTSSKEVSENNIFVALNGKKFDGHQFIEEVIEKGASAIIIQKEVDVETDIPLILVEDTYKALMVIGEFLRKQFPGDVIAVTGSAGKTMTKELIYDILSTKYNCLKSEGNKNNHIGVPLTLGKLDDSIEIAILEIGMNHKGEISHLSKIVKPNTSIITNIGSSHIGNLGSKKNIFKAKMEIIDGMDNGNLIVNGDDKYLKKVKSKKVNVLKTCKLVLKTVVSDFDKTKFVYIYDNKEYEFTLNMPGKHLVRNCTLAIMVGLKYGIGFNEIIEVIKNYKPLNNRLNIKRVKSNIIIDDCYNSNYEAVTSLIDYLKDINKNKVIILGDILELGKFSKKIHKKIGKLLHKNNFNNLLFVGNYMYYAHKKNKNSKYFKTNDELIEYLKNIKIEKSVILIKGSRGMHLEKIVEYFVKK